MQSVVRKWGNSLAVRLPQHLAADLHLVDGATVDLSIEDHSLVMRPSRKRFRLSELLAAMPAEARRGEVDWGKPEGEEVW